MSGRSAGRSAGLGSDRQVGREPAYFYICLPFTGTGSPAAFQAPAHTGAVVEAGVRLFCQIEQDGTRAVEGRPWMAGPGALGAAVHEWAPEGNSSPAPTWRQVWATAWDGLSPPGARPRGEVTLSSTRFYGTPTYWAEALGIWLQEQTAPNPHLMELAA